MLLRLLDLCLAFLQRRGRHLRERVHLGCDRLDSRVEVGGLRLVPLELLPDPRDHRIDLRLHREHCDLHGIGLSNDVTHAIGITMQFLLVHREPFRDPRRYRRCLLDDGRVPHVDGVDAKVEGLRGVRACGCRGLFEEPVERRGLGLVEALHRRHRHSNLCEEYLNASREVAGAVVLYSAYPWVLAKRLVLGTQLRYHAQLYAKSKTARGPPVRARKPTLPHPFASVS